jgi:hypothetical protein
VTIPKVKLLHVFESRDRAVFAASPQSCRTGPGSGSEKTFSGTTLRFRYKYCKIVLYECVSAHSRTVQQYKRVVQARSRYFNLSLTVGSLHGKGLESVSNIPVPSW